MSHNEHDSHLSRREFLKASSLALGAGALLACSNNAEGVAQKEGEKDAPARPRPTRKGDYDLVAAQGGEPEPMFDRAMQEMGGMGTFVKKGQTVVVKPNIGWDKTPEEGANTHPGLVKRVIEHCFNAGAKSVYVFDHTCNDWRRTYKSSGIERAAKDAGANVVTGADEGHYHAVDIKGAKTLTETMVHELVLDSDVLINVPILKHHGGGKITVGMKNLMGIVLDRFAYHRKGLHQCIADFCLYRRPDLTIVDAYRVMTSNGPRGRSLDDIVLKKNLLIAEDIVAVDTAAAKIFGIPVEDVSYIGMAESYGLGTSDLASLAIKRLSV